MNSTVGMDTELLRNLSLHASDWAVCALYMAVTLAVAIYAKFGNKDLSDYFLAGNKMPWFIAALSMSAAGFSTVSFVGGPGEAYANGLLFQAVSIFSLLLLPLAILLFLRTYFRAKKIFTVFEFLEERFDVKVRLLASGISLLARIFSSGVILYGAAQLLEGVAGWTPFYTVVILGSFVVLYSSLGGLRGVMLNDMIQAVTFNLVILVLLIHIIRITGVGPVEIWNYAAQHNHTFAKVVTADFYVIDPRERITLWTMLAIALFSNLVHLSTDQVQMQQLMATGGYTKAVKALWTRYLIALPLGFALAFCGLGLFYYYNQNPTALPQGQKLDANHVLGYFVSTELPSPMPGLIIAGMLAAMMGSLAAGYMSMSTMLVKDFIERANRMPKFYSQQILVSRICTGFFGICGIALAVFMQSAGKGVTDNLVEALTVWGTLWFTLVMVYLFGTQTKWMKARAIWYSMLIGIALNIGSTWILFYNADPSNRISFIWVGWPGFILTCLIAIVLNFIFEGAPRWSSKAETSDKKIECVRSVK